MTILVAAIDQSDRRSFRWGAGRPLNVTSRRTLPRANPRLAESNAQSSVRETVMRNRERRSPHFTLPAWKA